MADDLIQPADPVSVDPGLYDQAGQKYGLDPNVLRAISQQESSGNALAVGPPVEGGKRALGVMQILSSNLKPYGVSNWQDPAQNIDAGAHILKDMLGAHKGDMAAALTAYSGGAPGYADQVLGRMAPIEPADGSAPSPAPTGQIEPADQPAEQSGLFGQIVNSVEGGLETGKEALFRSMGQELQSGKAAVTGQAFTDNALPQAPNDELQKRMDQSFWHGGWSDPAWWGSALGHMSPTLAGAVVGSVGAGAAAGPEAAPIGGIGGAIAGNAATQVAQEYSAARADGLDHDAAVQRAIVNTGIGSTVIGAMSALPGGKFLGDWAAGTLKRAVSEFLINANIAGAAGAAGQAATAAVENKPITLDDLLNAYASNVALGGGLDLAHRFASAVLPTQEPQREPRVEPPPTPEGAIVKSGSPSAFPAVETPEGNVPPVAPFPAEQFAPSAGAEQVQNEAPPVRPEVALQGAPKAQATGPEVIDRASLMAAHSSNGALDLNSAVSSTTQKVADALKAGQPVTLHIEGREIPIAQVANGNMLDIKGQPWGLMSVLMPRPGDANRIEIDRPLPPATPAIPARPPTKAGAVGMPKPIQGTGAPETRGLSESVEASAIQKELVDSFGDLPGYQVLQDPDQGAKALRLLSSDPDKARAVAMGDAQPPRGVLQSAVFVAVKQAAENAGDVETLRSLATTSKFLSSVTRLGQEISYLRNIDSSTDPVKIMSGLQKAYDDRIALKQLQPKIDRQVNEAQAAVAKATPRAGRFEWDSFVQGIMCR